jgi:hypothetical protein
VICRKVRINDNAAIGTLLVLAGYFQGCPHHNMFGGCCSPVGFQAWRKDPRRLVGYLAYRGPDKGLNGLHHVVPGTGSYTLVSDRALFVHKLYLDSLSYNRNSGCCDVILSAQVSTAFGRAPVVVKAHVMDLLEVEGSASDTSRDARHYAVSRCDDRCLPSWLSQIDDWSTLPLQHTAIMG